MAMTLVKSEEKNVRRSYSHGDSVAKSEEKNLRRSYSHGDSMANGTPEVARRVKRRRREAAAAAVVSDGSNGHQAKGVVNHEADAAPTTVKRSSRFRGVSRHRWTGRYEAHLWDKLSWNVTQKKKGKQVYLGAYDDEEAAARAYDLAALKYWGASTFTNFPISDYETELEIMKTVTKEEYLASLRRKSSGFSRGVSKYRGVARHHHNGRWEARIGRVFGNKYLYLGTYSTQEEAARAYDIAAIEYRGINAVTNFELSTYIRWLKPGANIPCSPAQEAKPKDDFATLTWMDPHPHQPLSPCLKRQAFSMNDLQETEMLGRLPMMPTAPCIRSSPTALGLLLRSSVFRQLVEKSALLSEGEKSGKNEVCGGISSMFGEEDNIGDLVRIEGEIEIPVDYGCPDIVGGSTAGMPPVGCHLPNTEQSKRNEAGMVKELMLSFHCKEI